MSVEHLLRLRIDLQSARNAAAFYEAYANTVSAELDDLMSPKLGRFDAGPSVQLQDQAVLRADIVSALRMAAQWSLFLDPFRSAELLRRAGTLLRAEGYGFGLFLLLAGGARLELRDEQVRREINVLSTVSLDRGQSSVSARTPDAMRHPQQQAYSLVAMCAAPDISKEHASMLRSVCRSSPYRNAGIPVGALGLPIRYYWSIAEALLESRSSQFVRQRLGPFINRYSDDIISARSNTYLWSNGASPVDVGDIDIVGVTALATRRFGLDVMRSQLRDLNRTPTLHESTEYMVPLELGMELAIATGPPIEDGEPDEPYRG